MQLLSHLSLIDDEQRGRVEAVGRLPLQDGLEAAQLAEHRLKEVPPQSLPVVQVLVERLAEAVDRQAAAVVLVPAEVVTRIALVHLRNEGSGGGECEDSEVRTGLRARHHEVRTCMPHTLTPSVAEVLCSHFFICRAAFSSEASSPCCRVPIFRSRMQG